MLQHLIEELPQLIVNGLVVGTIIALPAIGFTAIYAVLRFPNFTVASHATMGAYAGFVANVWLGLPVVPSLAFAFAIPAISGLLCDEMILKRLRESSAATGPMAAAIAAVALTIALENVIRFFFGNDLRGYDLPVFRDWRFDLGFAFLRVGPQQVENAAISVAVMAALFTFLAFTRTGKMMRAVADNPMLAAIKGINAETVARLASAIGMGLVGVGGMLLGLDTSIDPLTGFRAVLTVFAAAVVGGLGSIPGAVVGAMVVGIGEELSLLVLDASYRTAVGFIAIIVVLTFRPRGILGERAY